MPAGLGVLVTPPGGGMLAAARSGVVRPGGFTLTCAAPV